MSSVFYRISDVVRVLPEIIPELTLKGIDVFDDSSYFIEVIDNKSLCVCEWTDANTSPKVGDRVLQ